MGLTRALTRRMTRKMTRGLATPVSGGVADYWADGPAPEGFHWEFVYDDEDRLVTAPGGFINPADEPVVALVEN